MDFKVTAGTRGFNVTQGRKYFGNVSAKEAAACLNMHEKLNGKKLGLFAGIKQSFRINRLLKKEGKNNLSENEQKELKDICEKLLTYCKLKAFTTQGGKNRMKLDKKSFHGAFESIKFQQELKEQLKPLLEIENSIINENGYVTIVNVSMRTDLTDWNRLEEGTQLRGDSKAVLEKVSDLASNCRDPDDLARKIQEAREVCNRLLEGLEVLEKKLPEGDSDKAKLSKIKDSFIQIKNQLEEIDE